jgi:hypothetical protein
MDIAVVVIFNSSKPCRFENRLSLKSAGVVSDLSSGILSHPCEFSIFIAGVGVGETKQITEKPADEDFCWLPRGRFL